MTIPYSATAETPTPSICCCPAPNKSKSFKDKSGKNVAIFVSVLVSALAVLAGVVIVLHSTLFNTGVEVEKLSGKEEPLVSRQRIMFAGRTKKPVDTNKVLFGEWELGWRTR